MKIMTQGKETRWKIQLSEKLLTLLHLQSEKRRKLKAKLNKEIRNCVKMKYYEQYG